MKPLTLLIGILLVILISCAPENRVYEKHQSLSPDVEWHKDDVKTFIVDIADASASYSFNIAFRYASGYMWNEAKVVVKEISPSGEETTRPYSLKIREDNGSFIGEPGYDIWDSTHLLEKNKLFKEGGEYTYIISHDMPREDFPYAMEVGLVIDKNI